MSLTTTETRPPGEPVIVKGQHRGQAYESTGIGECKRRWVRLESGNAAWFLERDLTPAAAKSWPPETETK